MSIHNMFSSRSKKIIDIFWLKKAPYQELGDQGLQCLLLIQQFLLMTTNGKYSQTSMAQTPMASLPWLIKTCF